MSFWDASALLPLILEEHGSAAALRLLRAEGPPVVWWGSLVECYSALERRSRAGQLKIGGKRVAEGLLQQLAQTWVEIEPGGALRERALRLLAAHSLRAADALQLAAALVWAEERPAGRIFICLDARLCAAARRDGFTVLPEE